MVMVRVRVRLVIGELEGCLLPAQIVLICPVVRRRISVLRPLAFNGLLSLSVQNVPELPGSRKAWVSADLLPFGALTCTGTIDRAQSLPVQVTPPGLRVTAVDGGLPHFHWLSWLQNAQEAYKSKG